ncbi:hypothetical protein MesoLjLc_66190 [Mesorhizobium sp. L-8-10]|nr:hypothetical protein MesoLjLc_66190 [Mesorhizobium sp. L-8-10]
MEARKEERIRFLRYVERAIRVGEFWRRNSSGAEAAIRRLKRRAAVTAAVVRYRTKLTPALWQNAQEHKFAVLWKRDPERAKLFDWQRLG